MLEHEQAAIVASYKPKPRNPPIHNNNHREGNGASRRHSSISQSVRLNVEDVRRYSTVIEVAAVTVSNTTRKRKGVSFSRLVPNLPREHGNDRDDVPAEYHEAVSFIAAMENIHFRTLEGYFCWLHAKGKKVYK